MILPIAQIIVSAILATLILLQERGGGISSLFGGDSGGFYQARRGMEKTLFIATIVFCIIFAALALLQLVY